jgi:hypothetical protein
LAYAFATKEGAGNRCYRFRDILAGGDELLAVIRDPRVGMRLGNDLIEKD